LREEHRLRVSKNSVFMGIFVRVKKSRKLRLVEHVACMEERRGVYRFLVGKPEGKRLLGRTKIKSRIII
jgi:hypothetical protein